jgi:hypothetical protein
MNRCEKEASQLQEVLGTLQSMSSLPIIELDGGKYIRPLWSEIKNRLKPFLDGVIFIFCDALKNLFFNDPATKSFPCAQIGFQC